MKQAVGLVGWRGMVGSVLMQRMREEKNFDLIEPVFFSTSNAGGTAPNVVQGRAKVRYTIRATTLPGMLALIERVKKIAQGAALMTETEMSFSVISAVSNLLGTTPLEEARQTAMATAASVVMHHSRC